MERQGGANRRDVDAFVAKELDRRDATSAPCELRVNGRRSAKPHRTTTATATRKLSPTERRNGGH